jgi:hypothetical protein
MSFSIWLDWNKPLTSLCYPPPGKRVPKSYIPLGKLPDTYYTVGELGDVALPFCTKRDAEDVAKLIPNAIVQHED